MVAVAHPTVLTLNCGPFRRTPTWPSSDVLWRTLVARYGAEQPIRLAVDPVAEVERIGTAVFTAYPEVDRPKAAGARTAGADRERPVKLSVGQVEGIDFAMKKAEVADQQMIAEPGEAGWGENNAPRRGEAAACDQFLDEVAVFIENRYGPRAQRGADLGGASGGRIGHINVAADVAQVERDEPSRQRGVDECAGRKAQRGE